MIWFILGALCGAATATITGRRKPAQQRSDIPPDAPRVPPAEDCAQRINNEKIAAISRFASVVSHEIKNPLASLKNIAYFFSKAVPFDDPRAKRMIEMLDAEVNKMNDMITSLLDMTRIKRIEKVTADIGMLAEEAFQETPLPETVTVTRHIENIEISVDPQRFKQVITTLITNARDAMPNGGTIDFSLRRNGATADIVFTDSGGGMDPETANRAFEPLFTTKTKVLGLGLTVAREIVNIHDGHIALTSEKGKGTTVTISFPAPPSAPQA